MHIDDGSRAPLEKDREKSYAQFERNTMRQPLNVELMRTIMAFCSEPKTFAEIEEMLSSHPEATSRAIIDAPRAIAQLASFGGIEVLADEDDQDDAFATGDSEIENAQNDASGGEAPESNPTYQTTDLGTLFCERHSPTERIPILLRSDPAKARVYHVIAAACASTPQALSAIDETCRKSDAYKALLDEHPSGLHPSTLISDLEKAGGLVWNEGWSLTEIGRTYLIDYSLGKEGAEA